MIVTEHAPRLTTYLYIMTIQLKTAFYKDYFALDSWCLQRGLTIACHISIKTLITNYADRYPEDPDVAPYVDRAAQIRFSKNEDLLANSAQDDSVLWLSVAASICGMALPLKFYESSVDRWVAIASCSAFNGGYWGIKLHKWIKPKLEDQSFAFVEGVQTASV